MHLLSTCTASLTHFSRQSSAKPTTQSSQKFKQANRPPRWVSNFQNKSESSTILRNLFLLSSSSSTFLSFFNISQPIDCWTRRTFELKLRLQLKFLLFCRRRLFREFYTKKFNFSFVFSYFFLAQSRRYCRHLRHLRLATIVTH